MLHVKFKVYRFFDFALALARVVFLNRDNLFACVSHSGAAHILRFDDLDENGFLFDWLTAVQAAGAASAAAFDAGARRIE